MASVAVYLLVMAVTLLGTTATMRVWPGIGTAILGGESHRKHALDGLRGILALSVMASHTLLGHLLPNGVTDEGLRAHRFANQLGSGSVALFFMISAYLFGRRMIRSGGRLDIVRFFRGRIQRVVPMYLFCVFAVTVISFAAQGFRLAEAPAQIFTEVIRFCLFDFVSRQPIDGYGLSSHMIGQIWSLRFEWLLYLGLPVFAWLYRRLGSILVVYAGLTAIAVFWSPFFHFFTAGLAVAQLSALGGPRMRVVWQAGAVLSTLALLAFFYNCASWPQALLLIPTLVAVVQGHRWFALLGTKPFRLLGEISYSMYLLQGCAIWLFTAALNISLSSLDFWQLVLLVSCIATTLVGISLVTFILIEKPLMNVNLVRRPVTRPPPSPALIS